MNKKQDNNKMIIENNFLIFNDENFGTLRTFQKENEHWFVATDVCTALGISNTPDAMRRLDDDEKMIIALTDSHFGQRGGAQTVYVVNESGLYTLILRSRKAEAKHFRKWVTHEVLPSIRKHGAYIMPNLLEELQRNTEKNTELLKSLANEQKERIAIEERYRNLEYKNKQLITVSKLLEETLEEVKPKVSYYDTILQNPEAAPVTLIAKDYGMPAIRFNALLHDLHIQYRVGGTWELYQKYADQGYTHGNIHYTKGGHMKIHTCWTQKGRLFLYHFLKKRGIVPKIEVNT